LSKAATSIDAADDPTSTCVDDSIPLDTSSSVEASPVESLSSSGILLPIDPPTSSTIADSPSVFEKLDTTIYEDAIQDSIRNDEVDVPALIALKSPLANLIITTLPTTQWFLLAVVVSSAPLIPLSSSEIQDIFPCN
jgi:hypothetical protein